METLGKRIAQERRARRLTQEALGKLCDVSKGAVSQWENDTSVPTGPHWELLCKALRVSGTWLMTGDGLKEALKNTQLIVDEPPTIRVPFISWVEAGLLVEVADPYMPGDAYEWKDITVNKTTVFGLAVRGTSMNRVAPEGALIVVDYADRDLVSGKYYVIADADGNATFKKYRADPPRFEPESTEIHETIFPGPDWRVIGRVIRVQADL